MDPATAKMLFQLGTYGPLGIMVLLLYVLLIRQQRETRDVRRELTKLLVEGKEKDLVLSQKLVELSKESIKADTEHTEAIRSMTKMLDSVDRRLS